MTQDNKQAPVDAGQVALELLMKLNSMNARLVRIETRQARQMLDAGTPINSTKGDHHAATSSF